MSFGIGRKCVTYSERVQRWVRDIADGQASRVLASLNELKAGIYASGAHTSHEEGVDYCRALCFLHGQGDAFHARQALLEELRLYPNHTTAYDLLCELNVVLRPLLLPPRDIQKSKPLFSLLCDALLDYTMLSWPRLLHLYERVESLYAPASKRIHIPFGHIVECGTAGGGSAVLMAVTVAEMEGRHDGLPFRRKVFALDTFSGMPKPGGEDHITVRGTREHQGAVAAPPAALVPADASSWGTGTCRAPDTSVRRLARNFNVEDRLVIISGLFEDTIRPNLLGDADIVNDGIALLHLDADWYQSTKYALTHILPFRRRDDVGDVGADQKEVSACKMVQVDDYYYWGGCRKAVDEVLLSLQSSDGVSVGPHLHAVDGNAVYFEWCNPPLKCSLKPPGLREISA